MLALRGIPETPMVKKERYEQAIELKVNSELKIQRVVDENIYLRKLNLEFKNIIDSLSKINETL